MKRLLILYYSYSNGNTKRIAELIQKATRGDIERISTAKPYEGTYEAIVEQGKIEVDQHYMPPIKPISHNIEDYDVIAIGTPTWWYSMAPAVLTLLTRANLKGKTVIPFMTNAGWPGTVIKDMMNTKKDCKFKLPMEVQFDSQGNDTLVTDESKIEAWILGIKKLLMEE